MGPTCRELFRRELWKLRKDWIGKENEPICIYYTKTAASMEGQCRSMVPSEVARSAGGLFGMHGCLSGWQNRVWLVSLPERGEDRRWLGRDWKWLSRQEGSDTEYLCSIHRKRLPLQGNRRALASHGGGWSESKGDFTGLIDYGSHRFLRTVRLGVPVHGPGGRRTQDDQNVYS